jgi:hypothetical protein
MWRLTYRRSRKSGTGARLVADQSAGVAYRTDSRPRLAKRRFSAWRVAVNETGRSSYPGAARRLAQTISGDVLRGRPDFDPVVEDGQNLDPAGEDGQNLDPAGEDDQNLDRGLGGG